MLGGSPSQQEKMGKHCLENLKHGRFSRHFESTKGFLTCWVVILFRTLPEVEMLLTGQLRRRPSLSRILLAMNVELSIYQYRIFSSFPNSLSRQLLHYGAFRRCLIFAVVDGHVRRQ